MDELGDEELDRLLNDLRSRAERRRSMVASCDDISGTHESVDGEWGEWMCGHCGIFLREERRRCTRCGNPRA